jgi:hypothetical protein
MLQGSFHLRGHNTHVIPAKAGIQCGVNRLLGLPWMPAYAGMTRVLVGVLPAVVNDPQ